MRHDRKAEEEEEVVEKGGAPPGRRAEDATRVRPTLVYDDDEEEEEAEEVAAADAGAEDVEGKGSARWHATGRMWCAYVAVPDVEAHHEPYRYRNKYLASFEDRDLALVGRCRLTPD